MALALNESVGSPYTREQIENIADERINEVRDLPTDQTNPHPSVNPAQTTDNAGAVNAKEPWEMTSAEYVESKFYDEAEKGISKGSGVEYRRKHVKQALGQGLTLNITTCLKRHSWTESQFH